MNPEFLGLDDVLALHGRSIEEFGGTLGIRDLGLLESALAMPSASFGDEWLHPTLFEMAGAYLFHIRKNHPFLDGNKRTALASAMMFLGLNGQRVIAEADALTDLVLGVAEGPFAKADAAVYFQANCAPHARWP
jgi:death-on-curing protein